MDTGLNLVDVAEVARAHVSALTKGQSGHRYILGGENLTLKQILDKMSAITGIPSPTVKIPFAVAATYAFFEEWITGRIRGKEPRATLEEVRMGRKKMYASSARAQQELGFRIVPVYPAMRAAIEWFRANGYAPRCPRSMTRTAIIAAMPGELKPLVRGWPHEHPQRRRSLGAARLTEEEWIAACAGAGQTPPRAPLLPSKTAAPSTWSFPSAGPEPCATELSPGQAYNVAGVIDARTGERFRCDAGAGDDLWLVTSPHGGRRRPKSERLAATYEAALVDMEAAGDRAPRRHARHPVLLHQGRQRRLHMTNCPISIALFRQTAVSDSSRSFFLRFSGPGTGPHSCRWAKIVRRLPKASRSPCSIFSMNEGPQEKHNGYPNHQP